MAFIDYTTYKDLKIDFKYYDNDSETNVELFGIEVLSLFCTPETNLKSVASLRSVKYSHILDSRFSWKVKLPVSSVKTNKSYLVRAFLFGSNFNLKIFKDNVGSEYIPIEWERDKLESNFVNNIIDLENIDFEFKMKNSLI